MYSVEIASLPICPRRTQLVIICTTMLQNLPNLMFVVVVRSSRDDSSMHISYKYDSRSIRSNHGGIMAPSYDNNKEVQTKQYKFFINHGSAANKGATKKSAVKKLLYTIRL